MLKGLSIWQKYGCFVLILPLWEEGLLMSALEYHSSDHLALRLLRVITLRDGVGGKNRSQKKASSSHTS